MINDAVANSEAWFGKKLSRELVEDRYFPFLKVGKNKETKEPDPSRGYYFSPKVNCYSGKWDVEIFDTDRTMVFPSEDESATPMDFVPSGSDVTCGIECKYIWLGAKGWGISWALKQTVVVPKYSENTTGQLQFEVAASDAAPRPIVAPAAAPVEEVVQETNYVEDSDNEAVEESKDNSEAQKEETTIVDEPEPTEEEEEEPVKEAPKKKTVVKKAPAVQKPVEEAPVEPVEPAAPVKKKVVRKKA